MTYSRTIPLHNEQARQSAGRLLAQLPVDGTIEIVAREHKRKRSNDQNRYYWLRLGEISEQAWVSGRQFSAETWHEFAKREFLPDEGMESVDGLVKDSERYQKWAFLPDGTRICMGSTTQLTKLGFTEYMTQIEAYATQELGVMFSAGAQYQ